MQRQVHLAVVPGIAQFVRRHGDGRKGARRFGLEKAEVLGKFCGDEIAKRHVVDEHEKPDVAFGASRVGSHRNVVGDDGDLAFEIDSPGFVGRKDRIARPDEAVRAPLVHQRIRPE